MRHFILFFAFLLCFSADLFSQPKEAVAINSGKIVARRISHYLDTPIGLVSVAPLVRTSRGELLFRLDGDVIRSQTGGVLLRRYHSYGITRYRTANGKMVAELRNGTLWITGKSRVNINGLTETECFVLIAIMCL